MHFVESAETQVIRVRKEITPVFVLGVLISVWLYFAWMLARSFLVALFTGRAFSEESYLGAMIAFVLMLPVLLLPTLSYAGNRLVITDKRAYIRKGVGGACYTIDLDAVRSYQHAFSQGRTQTNHAILFYLKCGKMIRTAQLHARLGSLEELLNVLRARFEGGGFTRTQLREIAASYQGERGYERRVNGALLGLLLTPFVIAVLLSIVYLLRR